ncbi:hypothetical protein ACHQM5_030569 [Ranunculus cassubicifolius]
MATSILVSDGLHDGIQQSSYLALDPITATSGGGTCMPMYGFLPCAVNIWGHLFLIIMYQYLLYLGDSYVSGGSELMFKILGPGIFGASAFQILQSLPQSILVVASGISGSQETVQAQVMSGVAVLAGSTVFLLTLLWGTCVVVGKMDLPIRSKVSDNESLSTPLRALGTGITTDLETRYTARILILSTLPFIIAQLSHVFGSSSGSLATLIALLVSLTFLLLYCFYQVFQPWIQNKRLEYLKLKFVKRVLLHKLLNGDGKPNEEVIAELFHKIDLNNDNFVTSGELKGLILGIRFQEVGLYEEDFVDIVMKEFDVSGDSHIDEKEFVKGISKWLSETNKSNDSPKETGEGKLFAVTQESKNDSPFLTYLKASMLLLLGTSILVLLAQPLTKTVVNFSKAANISSVYISFTMVPIVVNYRRSLSAITSIRQKRQQSASLTLSMIYSAAIMNNIIGASTFLGIVYARGLVWNFSAEVLVVVVVCLVMGVYSGFYRTFPLWTCFIAYLLYPLSLALIYTLTNLYGWF